MEHSKKPIVGITFSTFDLLHAGHIAMLREAKSVCDHLICGLQVDPSYDRMYKNPPVQTLVERHSQLAAISYVDEIIPYQTESDVMDILEMYPIDIRIIGEEYRSCDFTGKEECRALGIDIYYNKRDHRFSSSNLRERVYESEQSKREKSERGLEKLKNFVAQTGVYDSDGKLAGYDLSAYLPGDSSR